MSGDSLVSGIFIKNIIAESSAANCGLLRVGDRILGKFIEPFKRKLISQETFLLFFGVCRFFIQLNLFYFRTASKSAVDGVDIRNSSHELAVKTIKNASEKMTMLVQSLNTGVIRFSFFEKPF